MAGNLCIIFLPRQILQLEFAFLYGDFIVNEHNTRIYYVLGLEPLEIHGPRHKCLGVMIHPNQPVVIPRNPFWLCLESQQNKIGIISINEKPITQCIVTFIYYEPSTILSCNILNRPFHNIVSRNVLKTLSDKLWESHYEIKQLEEEGYTIYLIHMMVVLLKILTGPLKFMKPVLEYSTLGRHMARSMEEMMWMVKDYKRNKRLTVPVRNLLLSVFIDTVLGITCLHWLSLKISLDTFPDILIMTAETVVTSLQNLLNWLTGDPAGFKLNFAFNNMLARFFLFHIDVWWSFLVFITPFFKGIYLAFLILGQFSLSYQVSILADLFSLVSFHVYCIYVYAARLYGIQVSALISLSRLFVGRKHNPLRNKVDSCKYSADQLFIGTIGFTILLFLLPTTLMYYIVFAMMRLLTVAFAGILTRLHFLLRSLPLYTSLMWLVKSSEVCHNICLSRRPYSAPGTLSLDLFTVPSSFWSTIVRNQAGCVTPPAAIRVPKLMKCLLRGKLIFPHSNY